MIAVMLAFQMARIEVPYVVAPKMPDVLVPTNPSQVHIGGYIGERIKNSEQNRLVEVDLKPLLEGFHHQPGSHPWIGEHIGKWIHASTLAWANTGDEKLKAKLDAAVKELISCQGTDGYLGTYEPGKRFGLYPEADWDVWVHKYDLLGLLTYYRFTGDKAALKCSEKIGDLLCNTFGPTKKSILSAGTHMGMAATSVLEPVVLLYRSTGNPKYLEFAKYIVGSWEENGGPHIISTLEAGKPIDQVGNGKAYEMLSNLVGLCELARTTGEPLYLDVAKRTWADVVKHELYITGSASYYEHFHPGDDLPNAKSKNIGETCVTVTWMQLSQQLLRLTGEAKYAAEFERSEYNHLVAAQKPDGSAWCYYTPLQGTKPYTTDTCCCLSSGPRGMAIIPETAFMTSHEGESTYVVVNTLEDSRVQDVRVGADTTVSASMSSSFPSPGMASMEFYYRTNAGRSSPGIPFGLKIRIPKWARNFKCSVPGIVKGGWVTLAPRNWSKKPVGLLFDMKVEPIAGTGSNANLKAYEYGPFVMASASKEETSWMKPMAYGGEQLIPFSEIGSPGARFKIWFGTRLHDTNASLFQDSTESRSVPGNSDGSIVDGDPGTYAVTFDNKLHTVAWFAVTVAKPVTIGKIVFVQGKLFHDGGWFDSKPRKPEIEIQLEKDGPWVVVSSLSNYPNTSAASAEGLNEGDSFTVLLPGRPRVYGIRIEGKPASGDNPNQAFASCAELQAYP